MPFAQPLAYILVFLLLVLIGVLTAPLWMKVIYKLGKLMKNQLDEGTKEFDSTTKNEESKKDE